MALSRTSWQALVPISNKEKLLLKKRFGFDYKKSNNDIPVADIKYIHSKKETK